MSVLLYRIVATLFTALAGVGLLTVTGFPEPLGKQIRMSLVTAVAIQVYLTIVVARQREKGK